MMKEYVTTNIRVPASRLKEFKLLAVEKGKSVSELIREAMEQYLESSGAPSVRIEVSRGKKRAIYPDSSFWSSEPADLGRTNSEIVKSAIYGER
ncbi:MAG: CopG family transcriptional regulator [Armatimonadetes bacterium]|nr:CopG family transcriptional regulator [Armatimonadota bacterium]